MDIDYSEGEGCFHLRTGGTSYVIGLDGGTRPTSLYWGLALRSWGGASVQPPIGRPFAAEPEPGRPGFSLDQLPQEYPAFGNSDFRSPALRAVQEDGSAITDLTYRSHRIFAGKPALEGLPATYVESDAEALSLVIELLDGKTGLAAILLYTVFRDHDAIARSVRLENRGKGRLRIERALSASVDLMRSDYEMLQLSGDWGRERSPLRRRLVHGCQSVESRRGASGHEHNPFIALLEPGTDETKGDVLAMSLVYSGNFLAQAEVDRLGGTRLSIGINPFGFSWLLEPGQSFQAPEAVLVRSGEGLDGMSARFHGLYRSRLCRGAFRDAERPILINNWEATYFAFDQAKILDLAQNAAGLGIELCVLDDGWFGKRDDDRSSLGDWTEDRRKLPGGLSELARKVNALGLKFGLWFEPEMVSPDSALYREHPDWCLHAPERPCSLGRNQLVLDMGRPEVRRYVVEAVSAILRSAPISYVKWDMNRHLTEVCSAGLPPERQGEAAHRHILGVYAAMDEITRAFPGILFESCSGGGGRFDPGMLYYMPQVWTSDNTDALSRLRIQYGTSLVYPPSAIGSHVSASPNHQTGRRSSLGTRGRVAMSGNLGYELDLGALGPEELQELKRQVSFYKGIRGLVQYGDFHRLASPFQDGLAAWIFVAPDRSRAWAACFRARAEANAPLDILRLRGLDPGADYRVEIEGDAQGRPGLYGGDELMAAGLCLDFGRDDGRSASILLARVD
jgi:alpha-galactosidase